LAQVDTRVTILLMHSSRNSKNSAVKEEKKIPKQTQS